MDIRLLETGKAGFLKKLDWIEDKVEIEQLTWDQS